jgi:hypothetical protein
MSAGRPFRRRAQRGVLYVGPDIPDDADPVTKNALALRNTANLSGRCPSCGATFTLLADLPGVRHLVMGHEDGCPVLLTGEPE